MLSKWFAIIFTVVRIYGRHAGLKFIHPVFEQKKNNQNTYKYLSNILGYKLDKLSDATTEKAILMYHRIIESFKFAYARRSELGDEQFLNISNVSHKSETHTQLRLSSVSVVFW